ncbi:hypothetical protein PSI9734_01530 [Pseudidiomarina piscicola]|uniref:Uncharacterized protein n=1 Tax=Pseudidiomarina piscicola TaxID=2614830 RepID=A0A6S6WM63_9GAMM|nr:hypothetical protein [Pseudidiomarina piscicola]CAB0151116.1 hypothetical protein PSI9734_01530 [Pseudidiomarina piscicola]VZT40623.1 hypothetical protein PSI9734_01530 [Pseudomonas aeruginosa]
MKKFKKITNATLLAAPLLLATSVANAEVQTYIIEGDLSYFDSTFYDEQGNAAMTNFRLTIDVETTAVLVYSDPETEVYHNVVMTFVTNSSGPSGGITSFPVPGGGGTVNEITYTKSGGIDQLDLSLDFVWSEYRFVETATITQIQQPFIGLMGGFPGVLTGTYAADVVYEGTAYNAQETQVWHIYGEGIATSIVGTLDVFDTDGDGIADDVDVCSVSILDETVMFDGWLNSGVTNYVDESGCSIMDHYAACEAEEEEQPSSPWGWFQPVSSGPSYCETQVVYGLQSDGVIDHMEGRMLRNALRLSYDSEGPR